jgi:HAD superfamily hydrolase (TIGR01549 family)
MFAVDPKYHDPLLGVVFDLDGTLVLSQHQFRRMREEIVALARARGVPAGRLDGDLTIPKLLQQAIHELERLDRPESDRYRFEAEANQRIDAIEMEALPGTVERPGAATLLARLSARGYRLGLLTRSSAVFTGQALRKTGLERFFQRIRTRSDTGPAKPDPEALLALLRLMEVPPNRAVFVGDHLLDAECGVRAGVRFYAILPPEPSPLGTEVDRLRAAGATAVALDLEELGRQLLDGPRPPLASA